MSVQAKKTAAEVAAKKLAGVKENLAKYKFPVGHARAGECRVNLDSVLWDERANKFTVEIVSVVSGELRRVNTSDVFQIDRTVSEMKVKKAAAKEDKKAKLAAAMKIVNEQEAAAKASE